MKSRIPEEWRITGIRISSKGSADVFFGERCVRIPGEVMVSYFLANPYEMFWLAEEDRDIWPWNLPEEKRKKRLSETERSSVIDAVSDYCRHRKEPIIFLTREMEARSLELADRIKNKKLFRMQAIAMLRKEYPNLPRWFYRITIIDSLAGVKWHQ